MNVQRQGWLVRSWGWLQSKKKGARSVKYAILLLSLSTLTWSGAYWGGGEFQASRGIDWEDLNVLIVILTGVLAVSRDRKLRWITFILAGGTLGISWWSELAESRSLFILSDAGFALFFAYVAGIIIYDLGKTDGVTVDTIIGAVCAYLIIGAVFGFLYSLTELLIPGSFSASSPTGAEYSPLRHRDYANLIYYSFVTLSSVGFGDIVPVSRMARLLTWTESVFGQFYMAILVARLVALQLSSRRKMTSATE